MARKTPLVGLRTDLRSLRYSKDQFGGGYSGQPYVKTQLKQDFNNEVGAILTLVGGNGRNINGIRLRPGGNSTPDFLLRENSLQSSLNDVSRLTQLLLDFNPGTGPLFIAKQNLLSLANVNFSYEGEKVGFVLDMAMGNRADVYNGGNLVNQAYMYWNATDKMTLQMGRFNNWMGYERLSAANNFHYSMSHM